MLFLWSLRVSAYQTILPDTPVEALAKRLEAGSIDVITFTSSSTVNNFLALTGEKLLPAIKKVRVACIGPVTEKTAREAGLNVEIVPEQYTVSALLDALEAFFNPQTR